MRCAAAFGAVGSVQVRSQQEKVFFSEPNRGLRVGIVVGSELRVDDDDRTLHARFQLHQSHFCARHQYSVNSPDSPLAGVTSYVFCARARVRVRGRAGALRRETEMQEELAHNWGRSVPDGTRLEAASSEARSRQSSRGSGSNTPTLPKLVEPKAEAQSIDSSAESADPLMSEATVSKIVAEEMARLNSDRRWSMTRFGQVKPRTRARVVLVERLI